MVRRVRVVLAAGELVTDLLTPPRACREITGRGETHVFDNPEFWACRCERGLPEGARLVWAEFDVLRDALRLWFEHETFEEVEVTWNMTLSTSMEINVQFQRGDPRRCGFGHRCETCRMVP
jgi:hypothetical protein